VERTTTPDGLVVTNLTFSIFPPVLLGRLIRGRHTRHAARIAKKTADKTLFEKRHGKTPLRKPTWRILKQISEKHVNGTWVGTELETRHN